MKQTVWACDKVVSNRPCGQPAIPHTLTVDGQSRTLDLCDKHSPWPEWEKHGTVPEVTSKRKTLDQVTRPWMPDR